MKIPKCRALRLKEDCHVRQHNSLIQTDRQPEYIPYQTRWFSLKKFCKGLNHVDILSRKMSQNRFIKKHCGHSICTHCLFLHLYEMEIHRYIVFQTCTNNCIIINACKCVKIQFVCSHKTQLSAKLSLFLSYNDMFRPTIMAIVRLYMKPLTHMP